MKHFPFPNRESDSQNPTFLKELLELRGDKRGKRKRCTTKGNYPNTSTMILTSRGPNGLMTSLTDLMPNRPDLNGIIDLCSATAKN